ncbi:MAG: 30S ribosomal protein S20 [Gammaproteobacteria bacterium]|nr:30S ribosomal protein S20 [Gammaproteobacteria bacterium]
MANIASAKKRARQSEVNRQRNAGARSMLRTCIRKVVVAIEKGDKEGARTALVAAVPVIDRMAGKGIIHRNKAARHKSRLSARIQALG